MFKQVIFATLLAVVAATPGIHSAAYSAPFVGLPTVAGAYIAPIAAAYNAPIAAAYTASIAAAYTAPLTAYNAPLSYSARIISAAYRGPVFLK